MNLRGKVDWLNNLILEGKIIEAMNTFYHKDVSMQENDNPPTVGLEANIKREQEFVANTEWHGVELKGVAVGDNISMTEWFFDFTNRQYGKRLTFNEVAVQRWKDGKIIHERFYYNIK